LRDTQLRCGRTWTASSRSTRRTCESSRPSLARVTGEVSEAVAEKILDELDYNLFWQITEPGTHGVDLLYLAPDEHAIGMEPSEIESLLRSPENASERSPRDERAEPIPRHLEAEVATREPVREGEHRLRQHGPSLGRHGW
jgi:hypothetical protein